MSDDPLDEFGFPMSSAEALMAGNARRQRHGLDRQAQDAVEGRSMTDLNKEALDAAWRSACASGYAPLEPDNKRPKWFDDAISAYLAALPMGEPVAWRLWTENGRWTDDGAWEGCWVIYKTPVETAEPLYPAAAFPPRPQEDALREALRKIEVLCLSEDESSDEQVAHIFGIVTAILTEQEHHSHRTGAPVMTDMDKLASDLREEIALKQRYGAPPLVRAEQLTAFLDEREVDKALMEKMAKTMKSCRFLLKRRGFKDESVAIEGIDAALAAYHEQAER